MWSSRNLTFEGRILIIKSFVISQLIFVLQVFKLNEACSKEIERLIFGFIWKAHKSAGNRGIDRIKGSILKNNFNEGGLNVPDIECLDKSLKIRQYFRASKSNHPIKIIQKYCMEEIGYKDEYQQGYMKITRKEIVTGQAQVTINTLNLYTRNKLNEEVDTFIGDTAAINYAGSLNLITYLEMSNNKLIECV